MALVEERDENERRLAVGELTNEALQTEQLDVEGGGVERGEAGFLGDAACGRGQ